MTAIVFYFQVHQPWRVSHEAREARGADGLFDLGLDRLVLERVADRCYLPTNAALLDAIERTGGRFRCAFSISGTALSQMERWRPDVVDSFRALVETGSVELLCETSHHSHAALVDGPEFEAQVRTQQATLERLFGVTPSAFRNTELVIDEQIAARVERLGFTALMGEGADDLLSGRSPHQVYRPAGTSNLALLLRDYSLSDDIAFRFSNPEWPGHPLFADTYAGWLADLPSSTAFVGLFMDYETFGEHQGAETGVIEFLRALPGECLRFPGLEFRTPSEVARAHAPASVVHYPRAYSWADAERDISAWFGNPMQREVHRAQYELADLARSRAGSHPELYEAWRRLTTSDHTYYMSTKFVDSADGDVHEYFSHHDSPHVAYVEVTRALERIGELLRDPSLLEAATSDVGSNEA